MQVCTQPSMLALYKFSYNFAWKTLRKKQICYLFYQYEISEEYMTVWWISINSVRCSTKIGKHHSTRFSVKRAIFISILIKRVFSFYFFLPFSPFRALTSTPAAVTNLCSPTRQKKTGAINLKTPNRHPTPPGVRMGGCNYCKNTLLTPAHPEKAHTAHTAHTFSSNQIDWCCTGIKKLSFWCLWCFR